MSRGDAHESYYLKNPEGDESYLINPDTGEEDYAFDPEGNPIFAVTRQGIPFYATSRKGDEKYPSKGNRDVAFRISGNPVYAKKKNGAEFYPKRKGFREIPLRDAANRIVFTKNEIGCEIYPQNYNLSKDISRYAIDEWGKPRYPKNINGNEFVIESLGYIHSHGEVVYPLYASGKVIYPKDAFDHEVYIERDGQQHIAKDQFGNGVYAKKSNGNEFYPTPMAFAKSYDGKWLYARNHLKKVIFPKNEYDKNSYIQDPITHSDVTEGLTHYCKNGDEIYPKKYDEQFRFMEVIVNHQYATFANKVPFYPLDYWGNEYTINDTIIRDLYPITNDNFAIVPKTSDGPKLHLHYKPLVSPENIIGIVTVHDQEEYLTNVKSIRSSRSARIAYEYRDLTLSEKIKRNPWKTTSTTHHSMGWVIWLVVFVLVMGAMLIIWFQTFR